MEAEKIEDKDTLISRDTVLFSGLKEPQYPDSLYIPSCLLDSSSKMHRAPLQIFHGPTVQI